MKKSEDKNLENYSAKNFKYFFSDSLLLQHDTFVGIWLNGAPPDDSIAIYVCCSRATQRIFGLEIFDQDSAEPNLTWIRPLMEAV